MRVLVSFMLGVVFATPRQHQMEWKLSNSLGLADGIHSKSGRGFVLQSNGLRMTSMLPMKNYQETTASRDFDFYLPEGEVLVEVDSFENLMVMSSYSEGTSPENILRIFADEHSNPRKPSISYSLAMESRYPRSVDFPMDLPQFSFSSISSVTSVYFISKSTTLSKYTHPKLEWTAELPAKDDPPFYGVTIFEGLPYVLLGWKIPDQTKQCCILTGKFLEDTKSLNSTSVPYGGACGICPENTNYEWTGKQSIAHMVRHPITKILKVQVYNMFTQEWRYGNVPESETGWMMASPRKMIGESESFAITNGTVTFYYNGFPATGRVPSKELEGMWFFNEINQFHRLSNIPEPSKEIAAVRKESNSSFEFLKSDIATKEFLPIGRFSVSSTQNLAVVASGVRERSGELYWLVSLSDGTLHGLEVSTRLPYDPLSKSEVEKNFVTQESIGGAVSSAYLPKSASETLPKEIAHIISDIEEEFKDLWKKVVTGEKSLDSTEKMNQLSLSSQEEPEFFIGTCIGDVFGISVTGSIVWKEHLDRRPYQDIVECLQDAISGSSQYMTVSLLEDGKVLSALVLRKNAALYYELDALTGRHLIVPKVTEVKKGNVIQKYAVDKDSYKFFTIDTTKPHKLTLLDGGNSSQNQEFMHETLIMKNESLYKLHLSETGKNFAIIWERKSDEPILDVLYPSSFQQSPQYDVLSDGTFNLRWPSNRMVGLVTENQQTHVKSFFVIDTETGDPLSSNSYPLPESCKNFASIAFDHTFVIACYADFKTVIFVCQVYRDHEDFSPRELLFDKVDFSKVPMVANIYFQEFQYSRPIRKMTVSVTEQGLTPKTVSVVTAYGDVQQIPVSMLSPRRPYKPEKGEKPEPYVSSLFIERTFRS
eukprot:GHVP01049966.1.p1 GENE.GHVP01049966.1~~GHVP01049966.1.p1  ORF type:complete len:878 (+),score=162.07 GHVP01049966.1:1773-4406(+)